MCVSDYITIDSNKLCYNIMYFAQVRHYLVKVTYQNINFENEMACHVFAYLTVNLTFSVLDPL